GDGDGRATPTVDPDGGTVTTNTTDPKLVVTGTGEPGDTVVVTIGGHSQTTTINTAGNWTATFPVTNFPMDGSHLTSVSVAGGGQTTTLVGPTFVVDMTPPEVEATEGVKNTGDVENLAEYQDGVTIGGEGEPGATVRVEVGGNSHTVTVAANGSWAVTFSQSEVAAGEYEIPVKITATDPLGNTTVINETLVVDTATSAAFSVGGIAVDNIVNAVEAGGGVTMTGTAQAGATVNVQWNGATLPATVAANGSWTVTFPANGITGGTYDSTAMVTATDQAGNTATSTRDVHVDTQMSVTINETQVGSDNIVSGAERIAGIALNGTAEAGSEVQVTFEGGTRTVTTAANGTWTANFATSEFRGGTYDSVVTVRATDAAGNVATDSHTVQIDTEVTNFARTALSAGTDNVVNLAEASQGLLVSGTVEPGSSVVLHFGTGPAHTAVVNPDGTWSYRIPSGEIPAGENSVTLTATATDHVGNVKTLTEQVRVDTVVNPAFTGLIAGDGVMNAAEAAAGVTINGTVEAGARVVVHLSNGSSVTTTANSLGRWSATFADDALPHGEGSSMMATVTATDRAGNTAIITQSVVVDTVAPGTPLVTFAGIEADSSLSEIKTPNSLDNYTFHRIDDTGAAIAVDADVSVGRSTTRFTFNDTVPDGSYLVINNADAAGNSSSTLLIVDNDGTTTVDLDRAGLGTFDFAAIDLTWASGAELTISEAQLNNLTGPDHQLIIKGDVDDTVTLTDATDTGNSTVIGGQTYHIYTLGDDGASVLMDDDINTLI
ncbi:MAG: Ig-like domain-containing protein, partial [Paracoccaceae bacterium]